MTSLGRTKCNTCLTGNAVRLCARCKSVGYCSKKCQKADWEKGHKTLCQPGANKLAGTEYVVFPPEGESVSGHEKYETRDNDPCLGEAAIGTDSLVYLSDAKYGKATPGKITVFFFWAQFHKPGYKFLPMYSNLAAKKKYAGKVQFVGVSTDPEESYPAKFLADPAKKYSTVFTTEIAIGFDKGLKMKKHFAAALGDVLALPHTFVVDASGKIAWHQDHAELGATVPNYMHLMEKQLDLLVDGKPLLSVGDKEYSDDEDEGDEGDEGDGMDCGDFLDAF